MCPQVLASTVCSAAALASGLVSSERARALTPATYATRVLPIGVALGLTLTFGNAAYLYPLRRWETGRGAAAERAADNSEGTSRGAAAPATRTFRGETRRRRRYNSVAFCQILKAFAPVILLLVLFACRLERPSTVLISSIVVICLGTAIAVRGELDLSVIGVVYMFISEFCEAIKLVMTQLLLVDRKFGSVEGLAVVGPAAVVALAVVTVVFEDWRRALEKVLERPLLFLAASLGGVVVNLATNMMVAATSALTLRITALLRNIGIVFVSTFILRESSVTGLEGVGFLVALGGFALYQQARRRPGGSCGDVMRECRLCCLESRG